MTCKKHPKYKAIRKPTADCQPCRDMWEAKSSLNSWKSRTSNWAGDGPPDYRNPFTCENDHLFNNDAQTPEYD